VTAVVVLVVTVSASEGILNCREGGAAARHSRICGKTRRRPRGRTGQHRGSSRSGRAGERAGHGGAVRAAEAEAEHHGGADVHPGAGPGRAGELLGPVGEGRTGTGRRHVPPAAGALPLVMGTRPGTAAPPCAGGTRRGPGRGRRDRPGPGGRRDHRPEAGNRHRVRVTAAFRSDREDGELRDLGVLRPGHCERAVLGLVRPVHAGLLGAGSRPPEEGRDPAEPPVRDQAGTRDRAGRDHHQEGGADLLGRRRRGLRPVRGLPGRVPGPAPVLRRDHPLRLQGSPREGNREGQSGGRGPGCRVRAAVRRQRDQRTTLGLVGTDRHRGPGRVPAGQETGPGEEPVHLLPMPRRARPPRDPELLRRDHGKPLAGGSRPPLLPVKLDPVFIPVPLVLVLRVYRFLPGAAPSGRGRSSRAGGSCARGARAAARRRRG
jgi:hypothetical protein